MRSFYVYILASVSRTLYVGVTNNIMRRVYEHKCKKADGFTARYNINRLVYLAEGTDIRDAIAREKEIKGWLRAKKIALIEENNPTWEDFSASWYDNSSSFTEHPGEGRDSSLRSE
jgi:putative endonuclease